MTILLFQYYSILILIHFGETSVSVCPEEPCLNLCVFNKLNHKAVENKDHYGQIRGCQQIYCAIWDLFLKCYSVAIKLNIVNLNLNELSQWNCKLIAMESQVEESLFKKSSNLNSSELWWFLVTPVNNTEILTVFWISENQIKCSSFIPTVLGLYTLHVNSLEKLTQNLFRKKKTRIKVSGKPLIAEQAIHSPDFQTNSIYFDQNIDLMSACANIFPQNTKKHFKICYSCTIQGTILVIKIKIHFKLTTSMEIVSNNQIRRIEFQNKESFLSIPPFTLSVLKEKVLSSFENLNSFEIFKGVERNFPNSALISSNVISVVVKSLPSSSTIMAEVNVTLYRGVVTLLRYKRSINGEPVWGDGKLLTLRDLPPGKYVITCSTLAYSSTQILGKGWTTTEALAWPNRVIIYPAEAVVVAILPGQPVVWVCRTTLKKTCFTTRQAFPYSITNFNSVTLEVPLKTLPSGSYIWSLEGSEEGNTSKILIKSRNVPTAGVEVSSVFVSSPEKIVPNGTVKRFTMGCRVWRSSVRQKGFNYVNFKTAGVSKKVEVSSEKQLNEKEIALIISSSSQNWKGLQPDESYMFKLQAVCPRSGSFAHVKVPIAVNDLPLVFSIAVEPKTGKALITSFVVSGADENDSIEDYPLSFEWSYVNPYHDKPPILRGTFSRRFTTHPPPVLGDLKLIVKVCDVRESCSAVSSSVISVTQTSHISSENFENVLEQITHLMSSEDFLGAFGLSVAVLRTLSQSPKTEIREKIFGTLEQAIHSKIKDLTERIETDLKFIKKSLEFFQQATKIVKYFPKDSSVLQILIDFKNFLIKRINLKRIKRNSRYFNNQMENILKSHFVTLQHNDTLQNRMELLKDVRQYMLHICTDSLLNSFLVVSQIVNISVLKVEPQKESIKIVRFPGKNAFSLEVNGMLLKQKFCLAVAQFSRDLLGNTNESRLTQIYEVQVIKNEKFYKSSKNDSTSLTMTFHVKDPPNSGIHCMTWTKNLGWSMRCFFKGATSTGITCYCKNFGYFSAFRRYLSDEDRSFPKSSVLPEFKAPPTWTVKDEEGEWLGSEVSVTANKWDSCVAFKINADYDSTVGKNPKAFADGLKQQIIRDLKIPLMAISYLFIRPGSIVVTVFFVDVHDTKAESIVKVLVRRLHSGDLTLATPNATRLTLSKDPHHLKILVSSSKTKSTSNIRFVAYVILAGTTVLIATVAAAMAILGKKRTRLLLKASNSSSESPVYRQFHDEFTMNGSSASLAVCRTRNNLY